MRNEKNTDYTSENKFVKKPELTTTPINFLP